MMLKTCFSVALAALVLIAAPALAGNGKGKGSKHSGAGIIANCPPGLAKKNPPCIPPGQAKKLSRDYRPRYKDYRPRYKDYHPRYKIGDRIYEDYRIIRDVDRYGLREGDLYYLIGREVFRISPDTGRVLAYIGLVDALMN